MHFPGHERDAFTVWAELGFPNTAEIEENYESRELSADAMLRRFLLRDACTDVMPRALSDLVTDEVGYAEEAAGLSYGLGATALLIDRSAGRAAATQFLARLLNA